MRSIAITVGLCLALLLSVPLRADSVTFRPYPTDLHDLPHEYYFTWGMELNEDDPVAVTSATLAFYSIRNWTAEPNQLYIHLLDWAPLGVKSFYDNQGGGDNFAGQGIELVTYEDLPTTPQNLFYHFDGAELDTLSDYINNDGRFALGLDPDCHYWNCGVRLNVSYDAEPVPEPGCLALLLLGGLPALMRLRRMGA